MDWRTIPSLTALRAFEATARLESFSAAARELNVTHAAISQQVRALEEDLGVGLVYRDGRTMALTADGAQLAEALRDGFETIKAGVLDIRDRDAAQPLKISLTPAFATQWLMPRLGRFWKEHPDTPISLHPDRRIVDMRRDGMDLAIRFGAGDWPGLQSEYFIPAGYMIVAAPELLQGKTPTIAEMEKMPWVMEPNRPEPLAWLKGLGMDTDALNINFIPTEELAIAAARQGYGLYVELEALGEKDLHEGRLNLVHSKCEKTPAYFLVSRPGIVKPAQKTFVRWLKSEL
ncbi:LysR substrate-binding domain-containing protein [Actibacterium lipolyticum]|uniref:Glycine cleavage system transcriptional activator n=1 Tax=Actibacterium lipolyticum TaxID=1524263 RepID=A0A238KWK8_9RHOB|nr:LysR substrate-binding domain-containing protein [Actibacterium lipolyticum]SMX47185.1 Glycine cleavage system transcriptional activator [Actibacterium lipolyticum]